MDVLHKELKFYQKDDSRLLQRLEQKSVLTLEEIYIKNALLASTNTILKQESKHYKLPSYTASILTKENLRYLKEFLNFLEHENEKYLGENIDELLLFLKNDNQVKQHKQKLLAFAKSYVKSRLTKHNPKDFDCPYKRYDRLIVELTIPLESIAFLPHSINAIYLEECTDYMAWAIYEGCLKECVQFYLRHTTIDFEIYYEPYLLSKYQKLSTLNKHQHEVVRQSAHTTKLIFDTINFNNWHYENLLLYLYEQLQEQQALPLHIQTLSYLEQKEHLQNFAQDILEMKTFLIKNFNPLKFCISLHENLFMSFNWDKKSEVGQLIFAESELELTQMIQEGIYPKAARMNADGSLVDGVLYWQALDESYLNLNYMLVELMHNKLYEAYEKIDFSAIENKLTKLSNEELLKQDMSPENIGLSCELIFPEKRVTKQNIRKVRVRKFLKILMQLGCEVKYGKGSEITIYRLGGKKRVLGNHDNNAYLHPDQIASILKSVGVSFKEWIEELSLKSPLGS